MRENSNNYLYLILFSQYIPVELNNGLLNFMYYFFSKPFFSRVIVLDSKNARHFILYYVPCVKYLEEEHSI